MDTVYTSFLNSVSTFLLTEAWRIAGQCQRQLCFRSNGIDKLTDHGVLAGTDQVQVLSFDLVHHSVHFSEAHNAGYYVAADHERRYAVSKSTVDHEISCICDHCGVQSCDIAH